MSGLTITAAVVAALVAVTLLVFAGGGGHGATTTAPAPAAGTADCPTPSSCVQSARDFVQGLNEQATTQQASPSAP